MFAAAVPLVLATTMELTLYTLPLPDALLATEVAEVVLSAAVDVFP
jgi:hypothetical protein